MEYACEIRNELATMRQPSSQGAIVWVVQQALLSQSPAQPLPLCRRPRTDREIPIAHTKRLVRYAVGHTAAAGHGTPPRRKKFCDTAHLQRDCRLKHGGHDVLTHAGLLACHQSGENCWYSKGRSVEVDKTDVT